ncbi:MAG: C-GCAxxG-C-C family protein [Anaerolineales bacterium]|nr:C-GCAxxG-C-C family protein [Anaerolineales bacterium]
MDQTDVIRKARVYFLRQDNLYGCAETTFIALKEAYGLPNPADSSAAMALNGGVAYSGGLCGAITGAALAVGMLAERRLPAHKDAKRVARLIIAEYMDEFKATHLDVDCRALIGLDIRQEEQHQRFLESGIWRTRCMAQIEFAIQRLFDLRHPQTWQETIERIQS